MQVRIASCCVFLLIGAAFWANTGTRGGAAIQAAQESSGVPSQQQDLIHSLEGVDLYRAYCASCHGKNGTGNGPAAAALKATVPDLTLIAKNNGGAFPVARVRRIIVGEGMIASHGSREMPVWGPLFHQVEADVDRGNVRVENLIKYLQSIQVVQSAEKQPHPLSAQSAPSGEKLYKQNCAVCHGNDLKGNGPAPYPFKDVPPDLTKLSSSHGGQFPEAYVGQVLKNGVVLPAHGPAEMPTWGLDFRARDQLNSAQVAERIRNLSDYLKSQQAK